MIPGTHLLGLKVDKRSTLVFSISANMIFKKKHFNRLSVAQMGWINEIKNAEKSRDTVTLSLCVWECLCVCPSLSQDRWQASSCLAGCNYALIGL